MQVAVETIDDLRTKAAQRPFRLARLGARPLPGYLMLPPPAPVMPKKIEIIDRDPEDTAIDVAECRNQVVIVRHDYAEDGTYVFIGPRDDRLKIANIQCVVGKHFGVAVADILSARRTVNVVRPRQIAMYLAKKLTLMSYPEISRRFGGRDHTTAIHAVQKYERLVESDPEVAQIIETLTIKLKGRAS